MGLASFSSFLALPASFFEFPPLAGGMVDIYSSWLVVSDGRVCSLVSGDDDGSGCASMYIFRVNVEINLCFGLLPVDDM